jgi:hypothetical protein
MSVAFAIQYVLKQGEALSPLLLKMISEYEIRIIQENLQGLSTNGTHQLLFRV